MFPISLLLVLLWIVSLTAHAATGLVLGCNGQTTPPVRGWVWVQPSADTVVLAAPDATTDYYAGSCERYDGLLTHVYTCPQDLAPGSTAWCEGGFVAKAGPPPPPGPAPLTRDVVLAWTPPTDTDLAGYRIRHGTQSGTYPDAVTIGLASTYTWRALPSGPHVFVAHARDAAGNESGASNEAAITIVDPAPPPPAPPPLGVVAVAAGLSHSPVYGISVTGARTATVLGFARVGAPCAGAAVYRYRGREYHRLAASGDVTWWQSTPTAAAAVACATP